VYAEESLCDCEIENRNQNKSLIQYFLDQYISLLPLMSLVVTPEIYQGTYPTSSSVENHFRQCDHMSIINAV